ncbi:hypothetical protein K461DRAFT_229894, partial [Myriangium duriaei CBS 260.36]
MVSELGDLWIVLDALDESTSEKRMMEFLATLTERCRSTSSGRSHLLVTSRAEYNIDASIRSWARTEDCISLQNAATKQDINEYVRSRIRKDRGLQKWHKRSEVVSEIENQLVQKADGMFRWVSCQLDALAKCRDLRNLKRALQSLPKTLDETYERILRNIPEEDIGIAVRLLQFLLYSERPLKLVEAIDAVAVDVKSQPAFDPESRLEDPEELIGYCPSLIEIVYEDSYD